MAWDNPDDYKYLKGDEIGLDQWAWEFIRRNPEYIKDWQSRLRRWQEMKNQGDSNFIGNRPELQSEFMPHIPNLVDEFHPNFSLYPAHENNRWCLISFYPPTKQIPYNLRFHSLEPFSWVQAEEKPQSIEVLLKPHEMMFTVDTRFPWRPNLAAIQEELKRVYEHHIDDGNAIEAATLKSVDRNGWIESLRLWDALVIGTSKKKIAGVLFPELFSNSMKTTPEKRLSYLKTKAKKWIESNYIKLIHKHQFENNSRF